MKTLANIAKEPTQDGIEQANLTSILSEFLSHTDNDLHIFITSDVVTFLTKSSNDETYIDSSCSRHLSPWHEWFCDQAFKKLERSIPIHLGDMSIIKAVGIGSLQYLMYTLNGVVPSLIPSCLFVSELAVSLISVS